MDKRIGIGICVACLLALGCGSNASSKPKKVITLGAVIDQTGSAGPGSWSDAAKLAATQMNSALSAAGSDIEFNFLVGDSTNTPAVASDRAKDLVTAQGAKGLVVDTSQDDLALLELQYNADPTQHLDVPLVGLVATSSMINNPTASVPPDPAAQTAYQDASHWNFRSSSSSVPQGVVLAQIFLAKGGTPAGDLNGDGKVKVSIFASNEPFGLGQTATFTAAITAQVPGVIIEKILFDPAAHTPNDLGYYATAMGQLADAHNETSGADDGYPDLILGVTFPDNLAAIIQAYTQAGCKIPMVSGMGLMNPKILSSLGSSANGQEGAAFVIVDTTPSGTIFTHDLQAATGLPPATMDSASFDGAATLMLAALIAAQTSDPAAITGTQIRDNMRSTSDLTGTVVTPGVAGFTQAVQLITQGKPINYEGAQGPCDFDENGNVKNRLVHFQIANIAFANIGFYDCVSSPTCPAM
jgi:hypothetical protein